MVMKMTLMRFEVAQDVLECKNLVGLKLMRKKRLEVGKVSLSSRPPGEVAVK